MSPITISVRKKREAKKRLLIGKARNFPGDCTILVSLIGCLLWMKYRPVWAGKGDFPQDLLPSIIQGGKPKITLVFSLGKDLQTMTTKFDINTYHAAKMARKYI